ncbi:epithelial splicing regulatory protein 1 [Nematostella vectensis]|uniref:epithelial splicing regulatory protein 1 n=1 Tax=Nematostella vectensis TaxID=45351 RepID=UPI0020773ED5|nr:epithelial splicing regulatory protein 1 [Nematostella vectensis]
MSTLDNFVCLHCLTEPVNATENEEIDEPVFALSWSLVNAKSNQLGSVHYCVVKSSELSDQNAVNGVPHLSSEPESLDVIIEQFQQFIEENLTSRGEKWSIVTDGQLTLRHFIHTQAIKNKIKLSEDFYNFYDLRKEFQREVKNGILFNTLQDIISYCKIESNNSSPAGLEHCRLMGIAVQYLINEGHNFRESDKICMKYEAGPCLGPVLDDTVLRARGLPWQASDQDVANFFRGLNIPRGGIAFCLNMQGRRNGEAFIRFENGDHRDLALRRHKMHLGTRYIEVYKASAQDFLRIVRGPMDVTQIAANFVSTNAEVIIRMRGLPFSTKAADVVRFFGDDVPVYRGEGGILMVRGRNGKATGDAFVLFETEEHGRAALKKHREVLGSRYVELFRSSQSEVQQVLSSLSLFMMGVPPLAMLPNPLPQHPPFHPPMFLPGPVPYAANGGSNAKDCLRLRGLPFSATVQDVLDFLKEHAAYVAPGGVHMVYNTQGRPSGDAYVQLLSPDFAAAAANELHKHHMGERYIEVFPCSNSDISAVIASSTLNQTKIPLNNLSYSPTSYPPTSGVVAYGSTSPINGHTDSPMIPSPSRSPPGVYMPQQTPYYNCLLPNSSMGCGPVSYYPTSTAAQAMRMRMAPYVTPTYEVVPFFHHGYQVAEYGVGPCR